MGLALSQISENGSRQRSCRAFASVHEPPRVQHTCTVSAFVKAGIVQEGRDNAGRRSGSGYLFIAGRFVSIVGGVIQG